MASEAAMKAVRPLASEQLEDLLIKTSRTFAVSIPLLEPEARHQVGLAYLLFRIADTFEDAAAWPPARRIEALGAFAGLVRGERSDAETCTRAWLRGSPTDHAGYLELLQQTPAVLAAAEALPLEAREVVQHHTLRTIEGMMEFVGRADGEGVLQLQELSDLRDYCYVVAGIVGELLTDLFLLAAPQLRRHRSGLDQRAARFGEALQLVNILKDAADDRREGRTFLPPRLPRDEVFALARRDLETAAEYVELLQRGGAPGGQVAFTALPLRLARLTLDLVEKDGAGAKIARSEVAAQLQQVLAAVEAGEPAW